MRVIPVGVGTSADDAMTFNCKYTVKGRHVSIYTGKFGEVIKGSLDGDTLSLADSDHPGVPLILRKRR